jgi:formylglycine-generating enzyme required for sulfatase activity
VEFVEIGPGIFRMGSEYGATPGDLVGRLSRPLGLPWGEPPMLSAEMPVHYVEFRRGFWIARTEVTNEQYREFCPVFKPGMLSHGDDAPVVGVSWEEAKQYCSWLSVISGLKVRLPYEAEWECACRAGSEREYAFGDAEAELPDYAWFGEDPRVGAHPVGRKRANAWGLYDMHGNVWEWCEDAWHANYEGARSDGHAWIEGGVKLRGVPNRVCRGGGWDQPARKCRSAWRYRLNPSTRWGVLGFRPAFTSSPTE